MADTPYINKQNWGRELLDRLGNLTDNDGSINIWEELPTVGKDGDLLGVNHTGYTGILSGDQPSLYKWSGTEWLNIMTVPLSFQGEPRDVTYINYESQNITVLDPGASFDSMYLVSSDGTGNFSLTKYSKSTGEQEWEATRSIEDGYQYVNIANSSQRYQAFDVKNGLCFFSLTSYPSILDRTIWNSHIYCFSESTGVFQWILSMGSGTANSIRSIKNSSSALYAIQYNSLVRKINPVSGFIDQTKDLSSTLIDIPFYSDIFVTSGSIVIKTRYTTEPSITQLDVDLSNVLFSSKLEGGAFVSPQAYKFFQDPSNSDLIYFLDYDLGSDLFKLWVYNCSDYSFSVVASSSYGYIVGDIFAVGRTGNKLELFTANGASIIQYEIDLDSQSMTLSKVFVSGGTGNIIVGRNKKILHQNYMVGRVEGTPVGFGLDKKLIVGIYYSALDNRIIFYENSTFSSSGDLTQIRKDSNFKSVYATDITSGKIVSKVMAPDSRPAADYDIDECSSNEDQGIKIGTFGTLFSYYRNAAALSTDSISYTGSARGRWVTGIGFNAKPIAGRFVTCLSSSSSGNNAGIQLFDANIGKMMWEVKGGATTTETLLTDFPSANPALVITNSGFVGVKNLSPSYELDVTGTIRGTTIRNSGGVITSDPKLKIGMESLDGISLWDICLGLDPITFVYIPDFSYVVQEPGFDDDGNEIISETIKSWPLPQGIQYGYNAEEVIQAGFPELVDVDEQTGLKYLNMNALLPIYQAASTAKIQELEQKSAQQNTLIQDLIARVEALENAVT
jgi:hypothetical protein